MILRFFLPLRNTLASLYICLEAGRGAGGGVVRAMGLYKPLRASEMGMHKASQEIIKGLP